MNLVQQRGGSNVWERSRFGWDPERWLAAVAAGALLMAGLRRRSAAGYAMSAAAGALAWWAVSPCETRRERLARVLTVIPSRRQPDAISEASEESFPASDAPAWTPSAAQPGPMKPARRS